MTKAEEKGIFKAAVVVKDALGLPNFMTMFYMEPGTFKEEDVPEMFKIKGKTVPAILISQYFNTMLQGVPVSLPYQRPIESVDFDRAAALCRKKGKGWHLMTNTEFVYLLHEAEELGHTIGGNTNRGRNAKNPEETGVLFDDYCTLTGLDPVSWSHDGTEDGVFGICGNYWEPVTGLHLRRGVIEYIKDNDTAAEDYGKDAPEWTAAAVDGKVLKLQGSSGVTMTTADEVNADWDGCHISEMKLDRLEEVPEIAYKLGIVPHDWKNETAGIWADSALEEVVPVRGSGFHSTSGGGAAALSLGNPRSSVGSHVSLRSALYLEDWELVTELLNASAAAHA